MKYKWLFDIISGEYILIHKEKMMPTQYALFQNFLEMRIL